MKGIEKQMKSRQETGGSPSHPPETARSIDVTEVFSRLRKNLIRREAGVSTPHKANRISAGFSPGGMLSVNFTRNSEFFRSLLSSWPR